MKSIRVPMTQFFAAERGYDLDDDGYAMVEVSPIGGKLIQFALNQLSDLEDDELLILSGINQEQKILTSLKTSLDTTKDLEGFYDMTEKILESESKLNSNILSHREIVEFEWQPMDCITIGPDLWFLQELSRARKMGLIFKINGMIPPVGLLESMGINLVRYARKENLI
jgi:hypothetical protein